MIKPFHPFRDAEMINKIMPDIMKRLSDWDSVWDSVRDSVWASVRDSVWVSVWVSVWDSVGDSVWDSVGDSVEDSVEDSVRASVWAYCGSLFPCVEKWRYIEHNAGIYPYESCVDLWKMGVVASYDGSLWRLHSGKNAEIIWEGKL